MMHQPIGRYRTWEVLGVRVAFAVAGVLLVHAFARHLFEAGVAVRFAHELDYGEGIVWEQMRRIVAGTGYGAIDGFPAIVFHYPPVFHILTAALAGATGMDQLAAGRLLSLAATVATGGLVCLIVATVTRGSGRGASWVCGSVGGLIVFTLQPVLSWSHLMRVDMVALAFGLAGFWFGLRAAERPRLVHWAALCFVAALYTRQTLIAAPIAVFGVLLFAAPRVAWAGIATGAGAGLAILAGLQAWTDGGFLRHILFYNINRFAFERLGLLPSLGAVYGFYIIAAGAGAAEWLRRRKRSARSASLGEPRGAIAMIGVYAIIATLMLGLVAKSGSSINYFIEWTVVLALLAGLAMRSAAVLAFGRRAAHRAAGLDERRSSARWLPLAIVAQLLLLPAATSAPRLTANAQNEIDRLVGLVRSAPGVVISDDMVLLIRAGRSVAWEPAIFAELASTDVWDERLFVRRVRAGGVSFFVTVGDRGERLFDARYNSAVADAIDAAYPVKRTLAGYVLHLPKGATIAQSLAPRHRVIGFSYRRIKS